MILWKIYFYVMALLYALSVVLLVVKPSLNDAIGWLSNSITLVSLFGFSFNKKLLSRKFWQATFFLCVFHEALEAAASWQRILNDGMGITVVSLFIIVPIYVAFFLYAFKKQALWENGAVPTLGTGPN